ncbi:MAG TPA: O-antigen ligase family protein [Bryobacteraceae bacterium]|nr:O-antigen ligase family protein [Bryobacteraceae bacterium]
MGCLFSSKPLRGGLATVFFLSGIVATLTIWLDRQPWTGVLQGLILMLAAGCAASFRSMLAAAAIPGWGILQLTLQRTSVPWDTLQAVLYWAALAATYLLAAAFFQNGRFHKKFLSAAAVFALALCVASTLQFFTSEGRYFWIWQAVEPQVFGPFQSRNNYASFALLMLPVVLWRAVKHPTTDWMWLAAAAILAASVISSGSRAGSLLVAMELLLFVWLTRRKAGGFVLGGGALFLVAMGITGWDALSYKIQDQDPWRYRREMMTSAARMAADRPASGYGLGTYPRIYPAYAAFDSGHFVNHAHNDWAEWAAEGGLPFVCLLMGLAIYTLPACLRNPWGIGVPAVYLHALVDYPFQRLGVAFWVVVMVAAVLWAPRVSTASAESASASSVHG